MKEFLESTYGKLMLLVVVAGVWGVNIINFSDLADSNDESAIEKSREIDLENLSVPTVIKYEYQTTERDPFMPPNSIRSQAAVNREDQFTREAEYQKPDLHLTGVMDGMAIIKDEVGQIYFVSEGDTFNNIFVESIFDDSVKLIHQEKEMVVKLNP